MLCSQMIAKQNLTLTSAHPSLFVHESPLPCYKSRLFCGLRTLYSLLSLKITRILFPIKRLRTLAKTTEGVARHFPFSLFHSPFSPLTPLESALTQSAPVTPLESALTIYIGGWGTPGSARHRILPGRRGFK